MKFYCTPPAGLSAHLPGDNQLQLLLLERLAAQQIFPHTVSRSHRQSSEYRLPLLHFPEVGYNVVSEFVRFHFNHQPYQTSSPQKYDFRRMVTLSQSNHSGFRSAFTIPEQKHLLSGCSISTESYFGQYPTQKSFASYGSILITDNPELKLTWSCG